MRRKKKGNEKLKNEFILFDFLRFTRYFVYYELRTVKAAPARLRYFFSFFSFFVSVFFPRNKVGDKVQVDNRAGNTFFQRCCQQTDIIPNHAREDQVFLTINNARSERDEFPRAHSSLYFIFFALFFSSFSSTAKPSPADTFSYFLHTFLKRIVRAQGPTSTKLLYKHICASKFACQLEFLLSLETPTRGDSRGFSPFFEKCRNTK